MVRWVTVLVVAGVSLAGCGKVSDSQSDASASAGAGTVPSDGGAAGSAPSGAGATSCPPALASAAEIASTPRADTNLELLALHLSPGRLVADQATYGRLVRDITAIRRQYPQVADINYFAPSDGRSLSMTVDAATGNAMMNGTYHDWDCLNQTYGETNIQVLPGKDGSSVSLTLKGIYDINLLTPLYKALSPEFSAFYGGPGGGDGSTICVTQQAANIWYYVFDRASGDCIAGCTQHEYQLFHTTDAGQVSYFDMSNDAANYTQGCRQ